jgi:DNA-binding FrmR family transcriptional regulator
MLPEYKKDAALRLKVAAGHLECMRRMVNNDEYCIDPMKQLASVQGTLQVRMMKTPEDAMPVDHSRHSMAGMAHHAMGHDHATSTERGDMH